jgi:hypothetical protein
MNTYDFTQGTISQNLKDPHSKSLEPDYLSPHLAITTQSLDGRGEVRVERTRITPACPALGLLIVRDRGR